MVFSAIQIVSIQNSASHVAAAAETAAIAQTEAALLWQLAALDPRTADESGRFSAALVSLATHQALLDTAALSEDVPLALRDLMGGRSYTLSERIFDLVALGHRIEKPTNADDAERLLSDLRFEIANGLAPRIDQAGELFRQWAGQRATRHKRAIAWNGGYLLALAVVISLALLPFELRLRRSIKLLEWLASRDALTGALSRGAFLARFKILLGKARSSAGVGLIRLDLNKLLSLNTNSDSGTDSSASDAVLHAVASRLRQAAGSGALIGRLGSRSFAVALPRIDGGHTALMAEASRLVNIAEQPLPFSGELLRFSLSTSTALAPHDSRERSELLRMADIAMRDAKSTGNSRVKAYHSSETLVQARRDAVLDALGNGDLRGLEAWLQPIVECRSNNAISFEVLARWHHPRLGQVPPGEFLPIAEAMGKLPVISAEVRNKAFAALAEIDLSLGVEAPRYGLSINLSPAEVATPNVLLTINHALSALGLDMSRLAVELNEDVLVGSSDLDDQKSLQDLRLRGARLYLDNFGTGFSSLSSLHRFPLDGLKIARRFVSGIGRNARAEAIVRGVIGLAHGLGIQAIAEGVETAEEMDFVREAGCDFAQGFFIAPPMSATAALVWIRDHQKPTAEG